MTLKTSSAGSSRQFPICCILSLNPRAASGNWEMFRKRRHRAPTRRPGRRARGARGAAAEGAEPARPAGFRRGERGPAASHPRPRQHGAEARLPRAGRGARRYPGRAAASAAAGPRPGYPSRPPGDNREAAPVTPAPPHHGEGALAGHPPRPRSPHLRGRPPPPTGGRAPSSSSGGTRCRPPEPYRHSPATPPSAGRRRDFKKFPRSGQVSPLPRLLRRPPWPRRPVLEVALPGTVVPRAGLRDVPRERRNLSCSDTGLETPRPG